MLIVRFENWTQRRFRSRIDVSNVSATVCGYSEYRVRWVDILFVSFYMIRWFPGSVIFHAWRNLSIEYITSVYLFGMAGMWYESRLLYCVILARSSQHVLVRLTPQRFTVGLLLYYRSGVNIVHIHISKHTSVGGCNSH